MSITPERPSASTPHSKWSDPTLSQDTEIDWTPVCETVASARIDNTSEAVSAGMMKAGAARSLDGLRAKTAISRNDSSGSPGMRKSWREAATLYPFIRLI
jgi:hypothetical protein